MSCCLWLHFHSSHSLTTKSSKPRFSGKFSPLTPTTFRSHFRQQCNQICSGFNLPTRPHLSNIVFSLSLWQQRKKWKTPHFASCSVVLNCLKHGFSFSQHLGSIPEEVACIFTSLTAFFTVTLHVFLPAVSSLNIKIWSCTNALFNGPLA